MRRRMFRLTGLMWAIGWLMQIPVYAQEIKVSSGFMQDSVEIGKPVTYYLTARYPESVMALFPDSTFKFSPFEFNRKGFYPTRTANGISYDSAVYTLSTFEIDKVQSLSLPVFVTTSKDCTRFESGIDSIRLIEYIKIPASDSTTFQALELKSNTLYERVLTQFNVVILLIVVTVLLVAAIITWIFFGKKIIRYFKMRKLQKKHLKFTYEFSNQVQEVETAFSREKTEQTISAWKKYLEQLEQKPYTKLTTLEVVKMEANSALGNSLATIDKAIYGHQSSVTEPFRALKNFADERFNKRLEQIRHE